VLLAALAAAPAARAQQTYFIPNVETSAEWNTNRELTPDEAQKDASAAYRATVEARAGIRTPRSETWLRPRITYQEFPERSGVDPLNFSTDLRSIRDGQRVSYELFSRYEQEDTYIAEYGQATFDPDDPNNTPNGDTGIVFAGDTRKRFRLEPSADYRLTERTKIGVNVKYDTQDYERDLSGNRVGYDSEHIDLSLKRQMGLKTQISLGPYYDNYKSDLDDKSKGYGLIAGWLQDWSANSSSALSIRAESTDTTDAQRNGTFITGTSTNWGLEFSGTRRDEVGRLRYSVGRFLAPSSLGGRLESDQVRVQYERPLSQRTTVYGAARFNRDSRIGGEGLADDFPDRTRVYVELYARGYLTPEWYLTGGYRYGMLDNGSVFGKGQNHGVYLTVGFQGLKPPTNR
jgi:hypothetical protein